MLRSELAENPRTCGSGTFPLLRQCIDSDDGQAWGELFLLVEQTAGPPVRFILRRFGVSVAETEVVVDELFEELYFNDCRKLRSCRARNEAQFRAWLRQTSIHFTLDWLEYQTHRAAREKAARSKCPPPDRWGPDEATVEARLEEWEPLMCPRDIQRLLVLMGRRKPTRPISDRTRRDWVQQLMSQYSHLFANGR